MILTRFASFDDRTIGRLEYEGETFWTVERPWLNNTPFKSCIPDGTYPMRRHDSPRFGPNMWEIFGVPNRTYILLHVANSSRDVVGCVGLGSSLYGDLSGVASSRKAIEKFYSLTEGKTVEEIVISTEVLK